MIVRYVFDAEMFPLWCSLFLSLLSWLFLTSINKPSLDTTVCTVAEKSLKYLKLRKPIMWYYTLIIFTLKRFSVSCFCILFCGTLYWKLVNNLFPISYILIHTNFVDDKFRICIFILWNSVHSLNTNPTDITNSKFLPVVV